MMAYVIGSVTQAKEIEEFANRLLDKYDEVRYVKPQPDVPKDKLVKICFNNISQSDDIYVVTKLDGSLGDGVLYEVEYAKRLGKEIKLI